MSNEQVNAVEGKFFDSCHREDAAVGAHQGNQNQGAFLHHVTMFASLSFVECFDEVVSVLVIRKQFRYVLNNHDNLHATNSHKARSPLLRLHATTHRASLDIGFLV